MRRKKTGQKQLQAGKREPPRILSFGEGPRRIFSLSHCEKRAAVTRTERYISTTTWNPVENCPTASRRAATRVRRPLLTAAVHQGLGEVPTSILKTGPRPGFKTRSLVPGCTACYNGVGSEKFTASELYRCPNLSYNEDVLRERSIA